MLENELRDAIALKVLPQAISDWTKHCPPSTEHWIDPDAEHERKCIANIAYDMADAMMDVRNGRRDVSS